MNESFLNLPDIHPVFKDCRIVEENVKQAAYRVQTVPKGDPGYIMGQGSIQEFNRCPLKWLKTVEQEDTSDAMRIGSAVDIRLLTPQYTDELIAIKPKEWINEKGERNEWNKGTGVREFTKKWNERNADKLVLSQEEYGKVNMMVAAVEEEMDLELINSVQHQVMVAGFIVCGGIEIPVRCLIDIVPSKDGKFHDELDDLKVTNSLAPRAWKRHVFDYGLYIQGAFYLDIFNSATGECRTTFSNIVVEDSEPFITETITLSQNFLKLGRMHYYDAFNRYARCLINNDWPSYHEEKPIIIEPDVWMIQ